MTVVDPVEKSPSPIGYLLSLLLLLIVLFLSSLSLLLLLLLLLLSSFISSLPLFLLFLYQCFCFACTDTEVYFSYLKHVARYHQN